MNFSSYFIMALRIRLCRFMTPVREAVCCLFCPNMSCWSHRVLLEAVGWRRRHRQHPSAQSVHRPRRRRRQSPVPEQQWRRSLLHPTCFGGECGKGFGDGCSEPGVFGAWTLNRRRRRRSGDEGKGWKGEWAFFFCFFAGVDGEGFWDWRWEWEWWVGGILAGSSRSEGWGWEWEWEWEAEAGEWEERGAGC